MARQQRQPPPAAARPTPALAPEPPATPPPPSLRRSLDWLGAALLIFCVVVVVGGVPFLLAGDLVGAWHIGGFGSIAPPIAPTATPAPDLAVPRQAWIATEARVLPQPEGGVPVALLEPGFPVTLTMHQQSGGAMWSHIQWGGPSTTAGGAGWVPDAALVAYDSGARPLGDLGALSPALGGAMTHYKNAFAAALYFPDSGQLYRTNADQVIPLGDAFRPILLVALYSATEGQSKAASAANSASLAAKVASGDTVAAATLYEQLGDAAGVARFLASAGISGIQPAPLDWAASRGTPNALLQFYTLLATGTLLNGPDRRAVLALLAHASTAGSLLDARSLGSGVLTVAAMAPGGAGAASLLACGIVAPENGPRYVIVASISGQASPTAAEQTLAAFFHQLGDILTQP